MRREKVRFLGHLIVAPLVHFEQCKTDNSSWDKIVILHPSVSKIMFTCN